ncbi:MAG: helix-hairpin-helix domain-containing protein, partial [Clostridia bacterium]|nr:helix-hairpin-helix domain-containing protein [Clostridia bacterium]
VIDSPRYSSRESVSVTLTHREATTQSGKVNINTAGVEELSALSGIGEAKARAIVDYREENGYFRSAYELENVEGIGPALVDANIDRITL